MDTLRKYLNSLSPDQQTDYAVRCGTTVNYLRKAISARQQLGEVLSLRLSSESAGAVPLDDLHRGLKDTLDATGYVLAHPGSVDSVQSDRHDAAA